MSKGITLVPSVAVVLSILALVVTGSLHQAAAILATGILYSFSVLLSIIPIIGVYFQWQAMLLIDSWIAQYVILAASILWMITLMQWIYILFGVIVTILVTLWVITQITIR